MPVLTSIVCEYTAEDDLGLRTALCEVLTQNYELVERKLDFVVPTAAFVFDNLTAGQDYSVKLYVVDTSENVATSDPNELGASRKGPDPERGVDVRRTTTQSVCILRVARREPEQEAAVKHNAMIPQREVDDHGLRRRYVHIDDVEPPISLCDYVVSQGHSDELHRHSGCIPGAREHDGVL
jgi:hypothetical protein